MCFDLNIESSIDERFTEAEFHFRASIVNCDMHREGEAGLIKSEPTALAAGNELLALELRKSR